MSPSTLVNPLALRRWGGQTRQRAARIIELRRFDAEALSALDAYVCSLEAKRGRGQRLAR